MNIWSEFNCEPLSRHIFLEVVELAHAKVVWPMQEAEAVKLVRNLGTSIRTEFGGLHPESEFVKA